MIYNLAKIDESSIVANVIVVDQNTEEEAVAWAKDVLGGSWMVCSYDDEKTPKFNDHPSKGDTWDEDRQVFISPKPYDSWVLNESLWAYEAPVEYPSDDKRYVWDEETVSWIEFSVEPN